MQGECVHRIKPTFRGRRPGWWELCTEPRGRDRFAHDEFIIWAGESSCNITFVDVDDHWLVFAVTEQTFDEKTSPKGPALNVVVNHGLFVLKALGRPETVRYIICCLNIIIVEMAEFESLSQSDGSANVHPTTMTLVIGAIV